MRDLVFVVATAIFSGAVLGVKWGDLPSSGACPCLDCKKLRYQWRGLALSGALAFTAIGFHEAIARTHFRAFSLLARLCPAPSLSGPVSRRPQKHRADNNIEPARQADQTDAADHRSLRSRREGNRPERAANPPGWESDNRLGNGTRHRRRNGALTQFC